MKQTIINFLATVKGRKCIQDVPLCITIKNEKNRMMKAIRMGAIVLPVFIITLGLVAGCKKYAFDVEDGYNKDTLNVDITVDTSDSQTDFTMLRRAALFPGLVDAAEKRETALPVTLDLNYLPEQYNRLRIAVPPFPLFSTGMYAPAGEPVIIDVPANGKGLVCQIGAHTDNLANVSPRKREPVIYTRKQLFPGRNYVRNLFGGNIYIETAFPIATPVTLVLTGACKAPDFILGKTNVEEWKKAMETTTVPWFDFGNKYIVFTYPTQKMKRYLKQSGAQDPIAALKEWENVMKDDYAGWYGLSDTASDPVDKMFSLPYRFVLDIQPSVGYGHSGWPLVGTDDDYWFNAGMEITDPNNNHWGTLHEIGHNWQMSSTWSIGAWSETTNNLFPFIRAHRNHIPIQNRGKDTNGPGNGDGEFLKWANGALAYTAQPDKGKSFSIDAPSIVDAGAAFSGIIFFTQIFDKVKRYDSLADGWGFMPYLSRKARHEQRYSQTDLAKQDFLYESLCEYTGYDCALFFQKWGLQLSSQAREAAHARYPDFYPYDLWNYNPATGSGGNRPASSDELLPVPIGREGWTVTADVQETEGEDGKVTNILDGDISTFWHSQWYAASPPYPHWLQIDMHTLQKGVRGVTFTLRQNGEGTRPKHTEIWVGPDAGHLTKVLEVDLANQKEAQSITLDEPVDVRILKLVFTGGSQNGGIYASMAEIGAFK